MVAIPLRAGELVTLSNGFAQVCDHHEVIDGKYRLFTGRDSRSYIEFPLEQIVGIELVPDPPAPAPAPDTVPDAGPVAPAGANSRAMSAPPEAKLTPADLHQMLATAGTAHNLDVDLLASVVKAESGGNVRAVSRTGARGLMQLMPGTAADLGVEDSFRPEQNVRGGSAYLDSLLTKYNDNVALALAAYNAGPAAVDKYHGIPPYRETKLYVARVIHEFNRRVRQREKEAGTRDQGPGTRDRTVSSDRRSVVSDR